MKLLTVAFLMLASGALADARTCYLSAAEILFGAGEKAEGYADFMMLNQEFYGPDLADQLRRRYSEDLHQSVQLLHQKKGLGDQSKAKDIATIKCAEEWGGSLSQ